MVPKTALWKLIGKPFSTSRFPARAAPDPWLSLLMSPVRVELWLIRILLGLAVWVSTMKGSNVAAPLIVVAAALVPHQLLVAVTVEGDPATGKSRLLPLGALLPARRLKLMLTTRLVSAPIQSPPPPGFVPLPPGVEFPVIVTFVMFRFSPEASNHTPAPLPPPAPPPPVPAWLLLISAPVSITKPAEVSIPPPSPAALFPEIDPPWMASLVDGPGPNAKMPPPLPVAGLVWVALLLMILVLFRRKRAGPPVPAKIPPPAAP